MAAGHSGQFTPMRLPVNTVIHTTLVGLEPATFRSLSDALPVVPPSQPEVVFTLSLLTGAQTYQYRGAGMFHVCSAVWISSALPSNSIWFYHSLDLLLLTYLLNLLCENCWLCTIILFFYTLDYIGLGLARLGWSVSRLLSLSYGSVSLTFLHFVC